MKHSEDVQWDFTREINELANQSVNYNLGNLIKLNFLLCSFICSFDFHSLRFNVSRKQIKYKTFILTWYSPHEDLKND